MPAAKVHKTVCNRDCPDACGIIATVEDGRVVRLQGDPEHPVTRGFLCQRTAQFLRRQYSPERLTEPLRRRTKSAELAPVSWDEALDFAAERLTAIRSESGPAAIAHYHCGGNLGILAGEIPGLFFELFGPVTVKRGDICGGAGAAAQELDFGLAESSEIEDLTHARHVLLWGKNVVTSSPHLVPLLKRIRAGGAELVLIDPVFHRTAALCDQVLQPRPGGDFALAMAVARLLFERGGIDPEAPSYCDDLSGFQALCEGRSVAAWCAEADVALAGAADLAQRLSRGPTTLLLGWGLGRHAGGGAAMRALDALAAVSGNIGIPGGGVSYYCQRRSAFRSSRPERAAPPRTLSEPLLGAELEKLTDPPVRALWVNAANPVAMLPQSTLVARALRSREIVVVADSFLTDTAEQADVVLPTTTLLEADDLVGSYGHHYLAESRPVVPAPKGAKSDLEIMQALAARVGLGAELAGSPRQWKQRLLHPELAAHGVTLDELAAGGVRNPLTPRVAFAGRRFPTATGRAQLLTTPPSPRQTAPAAYPLTLMALSTPQSQCSQWLAEPPRPLEVVVHPAAAAGVLPGGLARLESALASLTVRVRHDPRQRRDVLLAPKGGHLRDGACANALVAARLTDLGEGGALYDEPVRLVPV